MSTSAALLRAVAFQLAERAGGRGVAVQIDRLWRVLVVIDRFVVSGWHTTIKSNSIDAIVFVIDSGSIFRRKRWMCVSSVWVVMALL
jgi:hypothetical protein